ncbi:transposase [Gammaproteobacteria bacterium]
MPKMYRATQTSTEVRAFAARVLVGLEELGIKRKLVLDVMSEAGYVPSARTVRRHRGRARSGEDVLSPEKPSGRPPMLDEDEREICAGFVLAQNLAHKDVHLEDYIRFVSENFGVKLSCSTASRYLELTGFSSRIVKSRASGYKWDVVAECKMMLNWVNAHREQFKGSWEKMASIDFTYTGHRTDHRVSYSASGATQPKSELSISRFTNCIITVIWADGVNRTPPVLFTLNQLFRFDRQSTLKRDYEVDRLQKLLVKYQIHPSRVIYVGMTKGEKGVYVSESADLVRRFWKLYKVPDDSIIFSDAGRSFFPEGVSVLKELGFQRHESYPPAVHYYLSPNDNCLHGSAKQRWRHSGVDFSDDVEASLQLLNYLDRDIQGCGKDWWDRNMMNINDKNVEELITKTAKQRADLTEKRLRNYQVFISKNTSSELDDLGADQAE